MRKGSGFRWLGRPGDKIGGSRLTRAEREAGKRQLPPLVARVVLCRQYPDQYRPGEFSTLVVLEGHDGGEDLLLLKWSASKAVSLDPGQVVQVTGRVHPRVGHRTYRGRRQTVITRAKLTPMDPEAWPG